MRRVLVATLLVGQHTLARERHHGFDNKGKMKILLWISRELFTTYPGSANILLSIVQWKRSKHRFPVSDTIQSQIRQISGPTLHNNNVFVAYVQLVLMRRAGECPCAALRTYRAMSDHRDQEARSCRAASSDSGPIAKRGPRCH